MRIDSSLRWFLGGYDRILCALLVFVIINFITSILCTIVNKKRLSSAFSFKGIFMKVSIFALVGIGHILDTQVFGTGMLRTHIIFFYLSIEGVSLIKNINDLGLPIPKKLKTFLEQLHKDENNDNDNDNEH